MGLNLDGDGLALFSLALGMGTAQVFQAEGTLAPTMDMLNNLVRTAGAILPANPFSIFEEMSSGHLLWTYPVPVTDPGLLLQCTIALQGMKSVCDG